MWNTNFVLQWKQVEIFHSFWLSDFFYVCYENLYLGLSYRYQPGKPRIYSSPKKETSKRGRIFLRNTFTLKWQERKKRGIVVHLIASIHRRRGRLSIDRPEHWISCTELNRKSSPDDHRLTIQLSICYLEQIF